MKQAMLEPGDPDFAQRVEASFGCQGFMRTIGATIGGILPGRCEVRVPVTPALSQQHGYVHAGVTSAIADTAAGYAAFTLFPADSAVLTVEFKINLLAPAEGSELIARARVIRSGKTITVVQADVFGLVGAVEKHVAMLQASMICVQQR
jgi:uncharacterized protein (TIGR00369 family)